MRRSAIGSANQGEKGLTCLAVLWRKRNVKRPVAIFVYMSNLALLAVGNGVRRRNRGMNHIGVDNTFVYGRCNLDDTTVSGGVLPESGLQSLGKVQLYLACYILVKVRTRNILHGSWGQGTGLSVCVARSATQSSVSLLSSEATLLQSRRTCLCLFHTSWCPAYLCR